MALITSTSHIAHVPIESALAQAFPGRLGISPEEFSEATGLGRTSTYLAIGRGEIPINRIGRRLIIPLAALDQWLSKYDNDNAA